MLAHKMINSTKTRFSSTKKMCFFAAILLCNFLLTGSYSIDNHSFKETKTIFGPADFYYFSKVNPNSNFSFSAYKNGLNEAKSHYMSKQSDSRGGGGGWINEGPINISGRMNTIAVDPSNSNIMLVGLATGGIFKTVDNGLNWYPVFDAFSFLAIGHIVYDPIDEDVVYVATGDPNISGYPFIGDGVYKSTDGGENWVNIGLAETSIVSKLIVHPTNNLIIYAATMGLPFERNTDRGLYKSTDAGTTWNQILYLSDDAGIIDIVSDPTNPDIIYAAGWNRIRNNHESIVTGDEAKIYKSTNGGDSWSTLTTGLPSGDMSRISLEINPETPSTLYASFVSSALVLQGIYKTTNSGSSWSSLSIDGVEGEMGGFGWYFDALFINPQDPENLFLLGVTLFKTDNDGDDWQSLEDGSIHADKHALFFTGPNAYILATDGGLYRTTNDGATWSDAEAIPSAQFYHIDLNPHNPGTYYGGMQDNGSAYGNSATEDDWFRYLGGDGFHTEFRPDDPEVYYAEYQNGALIGIDGSSYFDATDGISETDRFNWNTAFIISKHNPDHLYYATQRLYKSEAGVYPFFEPISEDLSDGVIFAPRFHLITIIEESDFDAGTLYVGTTDANVWRTTTDGSSWTSITATLPEQYVTDIAVSHTDENVVFVTHSGYKENEYVPHIHRSNNKGDTWVDVSGDLPQLAINAMVVHPFNNNHLFVATDGGVYFTINGGIHWERLGDNMPVIPVYDLEFETVTSKIIAGTHARSIWSLDVSAIIPLTVLASEDVVICAGDTAFLSATGALTYTWSPALPCLGDCSTANATPTASTTYTVTGFDALGNSAVAEITVVVNALPEAPIIANLGDDQLTITNFDATLSYQWYDAFDNLLPSFTGELFDYDVYGEYYVIATSSQGCSKVSNIAQLANSLEALKQIHFKVYPNPVYQNLFMQFDTEFLTKEIELSIFNLEGKRLFASSFFALPTQSFDLEFLPEGIYYLRVTIAGINQIKKIVKLG